MTTKEAIQAMLDGKKCKKIFWESDCYCRFDRNRFVDESGRVLYSFGESEWEIYEEQKSTQTVTIEKWLCKRNNKNIDTFYIWEATANDFDGIEKVKLLDTYEVTL